MKPDPSTFVPCSICGALHPPEVMHHIDDSQICPTCAQTHTLTCTHCGQTIWWDDNAGDVDTPLCEACRDYHYTTCARCNRVIHQNDAYFYESDEDGAHPYCCNCYHEERGIQDYYCKPNPIFYGTPPRYGSFTQEGPHYSITIDPSTFGIPDKENSQDTLNTYNTPDPVDEYPYYLANDMDDILNVDLWGETAFLDAVDEGWGWDWLWNYTALGSADVDYAPEPLWYNESLGEWTIYGVTYDHACDVGWGSAWLQLMSEMS